MALDGGGGIVRKRASQMWIAVTTLLASPRATVVACVIAAICLPIAGRALAGPRGAHVRVRWEQSLVPAERQLLETRFRLADGAHTEGSTWEYDLLAPSPSIIRALVQHSAVADTHHIDRARVVPTGTERTARRGRIAHGDALVTAADGVALALVSFAAPLALSLIAPRTARSVLSPRQAGVLLLLLVSILYLDVSSMQHMTMTTDEPWHLLYGQNILKLDSTRFDDSKMPMSALNAVPGAVAARLPPGRTASFLARPETGRYVTVFFTLVVALGVFAWTRELYGANAGLFALTLYAFDPNLLAHSQLITTDLYAAGAVALALYSFWRFLHQGGWWRALSSAFLLGVAQLAKYTTITLFPLFAVIGIVFYAGELWRDIRGRDVAAVRRRISAFFGLALVFVSVSLLVINVGFLFNRTLAPLKDYSFESGLFRRVQSSVGVLGTLPLPVPYPYLEGLDLVLEHERSGTHGRLYLLGELRQGEGFTGYYFYASLYKLPIATQLVLLIAAIAYVARRRRFHLFKNEAALLVPVLLFAIYFNFFYRAQIGIRYFLVVFPLLYVFSGSLFAQGIAATRRMAAVSIVAIGALILSVVSYYPHFLPYFNELVWDRTKAYAILADSNIDWGQNAWYVAQYHAAHPEAIDEPDAPTAGTILVRVNQLVGVTSDADKFRWLREHSTPVDHVAYGTLVYRIAETDLQRIRSEQ
jgi:4-amino-4-deoxy-L-arabinose transferase-like glycosyltransferase